jgi:hypothetical protein
MPGAYALFTLVGIADEDDLDAPDPIAPTTLAPKAETGTTKDRLNGGPNQARGCQVVASRKE